MAMEIGSSKQVGTEQVLERRGRSYRRRSVPCRVVSIFYGGIMKGGVGQR